MCIYVDTYMYIYTHIHGLPLWLNGRESSSQCRRRRRLSPWVRKIPWKRKWQPSPVFLPGKSYGQRSLADYSPWRHRESDTSYQRSTHMRAPTPPHTHTRAYIYKKKINNGGKSLPQGRVAIRRSTPVHGAHSAAWRLEQEPQAAVSPTPELRCSVAVAQPSLPFSARGCILPSPFTRLQAGLFCSLSLPSRDCRPEVSEWLSSFGARLSRWRVT